VRPSVGDWGTIGVEGAVTDGVLSIAPAAGEVSAYVADAASYERRRAVYVSMCVSVESWLAGDGGAAGVGVRSAPLLAIPYPDDTGRAVALFVVDGPDGRYLVAPRLADDVSGVAYQTREGPQIGAAIPVSGAIWISASLTPDLGLAIWVDDDAVPRIAVSWSEISAALAIPDPDDDSVFVAGSDEWLETTAAVFGSMDPERPTSLRIWFASVATSRGVDLASELRLSADSDAAAVQAALSGRAAYLYADAEDL
jgi:hypothetical protein